ncbi:MAG: GNAT family N-acetyltransferase [Solirubrobacterales bacterium]
MIGRIRQYAGTHGVRATALQALRRLRRGVVADDRMTVMAKDLDGIAELRKPTGVRLEELDSSHLAGLAMLNRKRRRKRANRRFQSNLDRGLHGFVGLQGNEIVTYYWWVEAERSECHPDLEWLGAAVQFAPGDVYGSDFYVLPEYRAEGTANEMLFLIETALRDRGFKRVWGYVEAGNSGARWLYSSRGYRPMGEVTVRKLLFHRRTTPAPPVGSPAHE